MEGENRKYQIGTKENKEFLEEIRKNLLEFGRQFPAPDGSSYYLGDDGTPWQDRNRETWITSRMLHVYSIGTMLGDKESKALAESALRGLRGALKDTEHGGWYSGFRADGEILPNKQCYAHAFVILSASSAMLAKIDGAEELLKEALELFDLRFWDEKEKLCADTWNTEFTVLDDYRGLNANMHTVEAFLAVADALSDEKYRQRAGWIIEHVIKWFSENSFRIPEHFTKDWKEDLECNKEQPADQFKPYGATPGHGIEWARLISQWALSTYRTEGSSILTGKYVEAAEALYNRAIKDAWNVDGAEGLVYTTDWEGKPVIHDRMHWTLAEAINTSSVLWQITNNQRYANDYSKFMKYLDEKVLDHENGSWFHQLNEKNEVFGTVWPGKSDLYHAFQATWIPYGDTAVSIASDVKQKIKK